jgi:hypothetical protein
VTEIRYQPPAPDKELPLLSFNLFHFPNDAAAQEFEENVAKWYPNLHVFVGRISSGGGSMVNAVTEQFTHCLVWRFKDFDEYQRNMEDYAASLDGSAKPEGDWPGYLQDHGWGFWLADLKDPVLVEHGLEEWDRRMLAAWAAAKYPNPERAVEWIKAAAATFQGAGKKLGRGGTEMGK